MIVHHTQHCVHTQQVAEVALELQKGTAIRPLWGTAQLFKHPRYMHGAATSELQQHLCSSIHTDLGCADLFCALQAMRFDLPSISHIHTTYTQAPMRLCLRMRRPRSRKPWTSPSCWVARTTCSGESGSPGLHSPRFGVTRVTLASASAVS